MDAFSQAKNLVEKSQSILIATPYQTQGDSLGSAWALFFTLKKLGKNASLFQKKIPEKFQFLTELQPINSREFVILIDGSEKEIGEMRYEKNEKGLKIYLSLDKGEISEKDLSFSRSNQKPDLLITLGIKSLAETNIAYEGPILNIDNQADNENFGEVNLIETTNSLAEISTNLIKLMESEEPLIDKNIATCLLTGIVWASQNFRNSQTRPEIFETAATLIEKGADHQKIIQCLYKQKGVSQIKILGRVLEKLEKLDEEKELYATSLTKQDFRDCQAQPRDLSFVIEELKFSFRYLPNLLILWESHASSALVKGIFYSTGFSLVKKILANFEGKSKGEGVLFLIRDSDLSSAKEKVLKIL